MDFVIQAKIQSTEISFINSVQNIWVKIEKDVEGSTQKQEELKQQRVEQNSLLDGLEKDIESQVIEKIVSKHPDFSVMSGDDGLTLPLMAAGGDGVFSVVTNLIPALMTELVHDCLDGKFADARKIHYRLQPFFRAAFIDGNPTSIKAAMNLKGLSAGPCRLPLVDVKPEALEIIKSALKECNI